MPSIQFAGVHFQGLQKSSLMKSMEHKFVFMVTANAEIIVRANREPKFATLLEHTVNTLDGQIPFSIAKLFFPHVAIEKISGSDFIYDLCQYAKQTQKKVFLLGGYESSNTQAQIVLQRQFSVTLSGFAPPKCAVPFPQDVDSAICNSIAEFRPDILLVGFGAGKQEFWIEAHQELLRDCGVKLAMGCGGTFEFVSGLIPRAPRILQRLGLEGFYRLVREPKWFRVKRLLLSCNFFYDLVRKPRILHAD